MSHYRRRAGLCAPLILAVTLRVIMGVALSQFALPVSAQAPAPLPPISDPNKSQNTVLIPDRGEVTVLKLDDQLRVGKPIEDGKALTFTSSDSIEGTVDREMRLKGRAQIRRNGAVIKADEIQYDPDTDVADLIGNTEFSKGNATFRGPKARFKVDAREGEMDAPNYELRDNRASGNAKKLTIETSDVFVFDKATYTTCTPENLDWYFTASTLEIDNEQKEMVGTHGVMRFFDVPIAYVPYFTAPTSNQRRSGILAPVAGYNSNNGIDITQPYYVNIAPNRDLLLIPRVMAQRGVQLGAKYQFLDKQYAGTLGGDYLPYDRKTGTDRWRYDWQQRQNFSGDLLGLGGIPIAGAWTGYANVARVSDNLYPTDFSQSIAGAVTSQFRQEVGTTKNLTGSLSNWNVSAKAVTFQTLQPDPTAIVQSPYNILPNINASYSNRLTPTVSDATGKYLTLPSGPITTFSTDYTRFSYNVNGNLAAAPAGYLYSQADRTVIKGAMALPQVTPGYYITPKVSFQANNYAASAYTPGAPPAQGFAIPTFSLDSGLAFERDAAELKGFFGRDMLLTMEPRAFYVYTPYQNQALTPLFDTTDAGFGVTQIFSENTFVGNDRIADNNKLTGGLTSRMIEASTGAERANVTIAQRQDFTGQRVGLNGNIVNPTTYSDTLGSASVRLLGNFSADMFGQYNTQLNKFVQTTVGGSWRPTPGRSLNFGYRNVWTPPTQALGPTPATLAQTTTDQYNISGQWPLTREISVLGRWGYDALTTKTLNSLVALEWMRDCWTFRGAYSQVLNTSQITTTQVLFQIEFRGFGSAGSNPVDIMKLNVPGYMPTSKPIPPSIYENYQ
ncbi:LPS-assembly protein LptD [Polynucleobacter sp. AP-Nino-20-G2]|uniref:LPS-assembly protein LptD n=1 Tax=Polynucleobacter sp. AP-Nino-20-G2 TaxID=2576917 RepID=UPI001BFE261F|nr:LPS assembly protein LptD [Polynucleobacter sp. AP-Nino-20-G2]QWE16466.1 LPS-assembly protein LptD [Polynucleobacter sp. AP-Nino-20-G2]